MASSVGAGSRQIVSRVQRKRRIQYDELTEHIQLEKLEELEQTATTEELYHQQKIKENGVAIGDSRSGLVSLAAR